MKYHHLLLALLAVPVAGWGAVEGSLDPESVVECWSGTSTAQRVIDINFSDVTWPDTWNGQTGKDCPEWSADPEKNPYVNAIINVPVQGSENDVKYPVMFHHCTFATKASYGGYAGATAAFSRMYYLNENVTGNSATTYNNWTVPGHTVRLEDNVVTNAAGRPIYGEAGFVQMCRNASADGGQTSLHGWMEIDHIPYVERIEWSWSSTSWGRGIKCDIKIGDADWTPLVWMGSEKQKQGWTVFSDQGYFMENIINAADVSLRWRVWDGEIEGAPVQSDVFNQYADPMAQRQAPRVHKLRIYGNDITAEQARYAREHPVSDPGELTDLSRFGGQGGGTDYTEPAAGGMLAFPTAEGFGKYATGGRGGKVVKVTSLADDGKPGTLRWAFTQHPGEPITILFDVCGEIALAGELRVSRSDWTLAGQSAPGQGIVVTHNKVNLGGSRNFIVRNMRFRIGRLDAAGNVLAENAVGAENCYNFIFDHCSFGWSVEENLNTADSHFLTVQHSIIHEGLYNAGHSKGARGYGAQLGGSPATYHHNLLAHNNSRSARLNGARGEDYLVFMEYANNVNYNYGKRGGCYGGENTADISDYNGLNSAHECNVMANYYKPGPVSDTDRVTFVNSSYAREGATSWAPAQWYVADNKAEGFPAATADNWTAMEAEHYTLDQIKAPARITPANAYYKYTLAATVGDYTPAKYMLEGLQNADDAFAAVTAKAGTIRPDAVEARVLAETKGGTAKYGNKGIIDREDQAEGFFGYDAASPTADTDGDGLPDAWELERAASLSELDNNTVLSGGYTALEVYLNSLMGDPDPSSALPAVVNGVNEAQAEYFNLQGIRVAEPSQGVYIRRQGSEVTKIVL